MKRFTAFLLTWAVGAVVVAAPAPTESTETIKDRTTFLPQRKYKPLPGKTIGVLVSDVAGFMSVEGRSGPPDAYAFSAGNASYRWMYISKPQKQLIPSDFQIRIGEKGDKTRTYSGLGMASAAEVKRWDITVPYALVEFEVNDGDGTPAEETFVATKMKRLDDTKDYPFKVAEVVDQLRKRYATYVKEHQKETDDSLAEIQKSVLKDKKLTGPRQTKELLYITWLPDTQHLRVCFRTTIADGAFETVEGPGRGGPGGLDRGIAPGKPVGFNQGLAAFPPPPPPRFKMIAGTEVTVEFGVAYEVTKDGRVVKVSILPNATSSQEVQRVGDRLPPVPPQNLNPPGTPPPPPGI